MEYFGFQTGEAGKPIMYNFEKATWHIMGGCGNKLLLAMNGNMSNFLKHLRRHHLKWYAELIEAQEKG